MHKISLVSGSDIAASSKLEVQTAFKLMIANTKIYSVLLFSHGWTKIWSYLDFENEIDTVKEVLKEVFRHFTRVKSITMWKYFITSKSPAFILLYFKYQQPINTHNDPAES